MAHSSTQKRVHDMPNWYTPQPFFLEWLRKFFCRKVCCIVELFFRKCVFSTFAPFVIVESVACSIENQYKVGNKCPIPCMVHSMLHDSRSNVSTLFFEMMAWVWHGFFFNWFTLVPPKNAIHIFFYYFYVLSMSCTVWQV